MLDSVPDGDVGNTLTLSAGAAVPPGAYSLKVTAHGTGITEKTVPITLAVYDGRPASPP